ncbi:hypothetical protein GALMADRAFT_411782 [Galerina marginata CBS 339.88]|uniref:Uncharacterized protein n=1 Tax=Galerina marginata (strain CBS 339.88) TaxID=685588 RepID=A0A067TFG6_GALM3|nr:hypothetical protein GALMADRAFT_411782 [Galerina marginata CBS 339.88]
MAPTVMIARVFWESASGVNSPPSTFRVSTLQFQGHQSRSQGRGELVTSVGLTIV